MQSGAGVEDDSSTPAALLAAGDAALLEAAFRTDDYLPALQLLEGARDQASRAGDRAAEATALTRLGMLMHFAALGGDLTAADWAAEERLFQVALAIQRELGDAAGAAESLFGLGLVHQVLRGDWAAAMPFYREALTLAEGYADEMVRSEVHRHIGFYYVFVTGDGDQGLRHLRMSQVLRERYGDRGGWPPARSPWARPSWPSAIARWRSACFGRRSTRRGRPG